MFGALFESLDREPSQDIPVGRLERVRQSLRRRLSDQLEDVLHRACVENDLLTAAGLLDVLEDLQNRRQQIYGRERRINDEGIVKARQAVELCRERNPSLVEILQATKHVEPTPIEEPPIKIDLLETPLPPDFFEDATAGQDEQPSYSLGEGNWTNPITDQSSRLSKKI
jgi:hypothetical protein